MSAVAEQIADLDEWTNVRLAEGIDLLSGRHVLAQFCNSDGQGVPYLTGPADFPEGRIQQTKFTTHPSTLCEAGDILITVKGSGAGKLTRADARYCISRQLMAIRASEWDSRFVEYALQASTTIADAATGLIPGISRDDILGMVVALPPLREQHAIATALSDTDGLIEALESLIAKKRAVKQGATQALLSAHTRLPGFFGEWVERRLGDLYSFKNGLNKAKEFFGAGTPIINYMDVFTAPHIGAKDIDGLVTVGTSERDNFSARKGDVFFTRTSETVDEIGLASVLMTEIDDAVFSGFVLRARPIGDVLDGLFAGYALRSEGLRRQVVATASYTTRALTNGRLLSATSIFVPPREEQVAIAKMIRDMDDELVAIETRLAKARAIKQGMMQELLTGRVRLV